MKTEHLLSIARECREQTRQMTPAQLDDWYADHVGYRISKDDPSLKDNLRAHQAAVADVMFFSRLNEGEDTAETQDIAKRLSNAILSDEEL